VIRRSTGGRTAAAEKPRKAGIRAHIRIGYPPQEIVEACRSDIDLLVVGA
jgi:hypothetical protein